MTIERYFEVPEKEREEFIEKKHFIGYYGKEVSDIVYQLAGQDANVLFFLNLAKKTFSPNGNNGLLVLSQMAEISEIRKLHCSQRTSDKLSKAIYFEKMAYERIKELNQMIIDRGKEVFFVDNLLGFEEEASEKAKWFLRLEGIISSFVKGAISNATPNNREYLKQRTLRVAENYLAPGNGDNILFPALSVLDNASYHGKLKEYLDKLERHNQNIVQHISFKDRGNEYNPGIILTNRFFDKCQKELHSLKE